METNRARRRGSPALMSAGRAQCGVNVSTKYRRKAVVNRSRSTPGRNSAISDRTVNMLEKMMKKANLSQHQIKAFKQQVTATGRVPIDLELKRSGTYRPQQPRLSRKEAMAQPIKKFYARKRSKSEIKVADRRNFYSNQSSKGKDMRREKERYISLMENDGHEIKAKPVRKKMSDVVLPPKKSRVQELEEEIEERLVFLGEMDALGQGAKYKSRIMREVQEVERMIWSDLH